MSDDANGSAPATASVVLMTAFHYPPCHGSSGIQRTLGFSRYLPNSGWHPLVLTAAGRAYPETSTALIGTESSHTRVVRAAAWDAARHLSIMGRYPQWLARPDRWASWILPAVIRGLWECRRGRVDVLWSTFPIASAHVIAHILKRFTGRPWIADFRDPMWEGDYPRHPLLRRSAQRIEASVVRSADRVVVTTEGTRDLLVERYPDLPRAKFSVIENGFDEQQFPSGPGFAGPLRETPGIIRMVHSGTLYPSERDPRGLFVALAELRRAGAVDASRLRIILRATGHDREIGALVNHFGIADMVTLEAAVSYSEALREMCEADVLLLLQAENCDRQVPAKLYEYLRAGRPILALVGPNGDTAKAVRELDWVLCAPLSDPLGIGAALRRVLDRNWLGSREINWDHVRRFDRRALAGRLGALLDELSGLRPAPLPES